MLKNIDVFVTLCKKSVSLFQNNAFHSFMCKVKKNGYIYHISTISERRLYISLYLESHTYIYISPYIYIYGDRRRGGKGSASRVPLSHSCVNTKTREKGGVFGTGKGG